MGRVSLALRKLCLFFFPGWGLPSNGPAPVKGLSAWAPGKVPASPAPGTLPRGPKHPTTPLGWHNGRGSAFHRVLLLPFPSSGAHSLGARWSDPSCGAGDTMALGLLCAPLMLRSLGQGRPGAPDLHR